MEAQTKGTDLLMEVNNFKLSYDDLGEGEIPIIFLHGFPFNKNMWKGQLDFLKETNRVITCDIRGFGRSKDEDSVLSIDLFADDLVQFMSQLKIDKAIICGLSMGGFIALNALQRFPERFDALILCDTQCIADTAEVRAKRYTIIEDIELEGARTFNEGFIKSVFHHNSLQNKEKLVDTLRKVVFSNSQHIITSGLTALAERSETCSSLDAIHVPTLIICGREDEVTPLVQSESMHTEIKGSVLQIIEKAGHVSNLEQEKEFNKHLSTFLNTLENIRLKHSTENNVSV